MNTTEKQSTAHHYPALDGLRGIAALMIVWYHFLLLSPRQGVLLSFVTRSFGFGWAGVDLFFVLSGFLITGILVDSKSRNHYFRTFYGRRVLRIFPLYYGVLAVVFFILPLVGAEPRVPSSSKIFFWTYTSNLYFQSNGGINADYLRHFWTLAIEEQFYLVWPLIIWFASSLDRLRVGLICGFISVSILRCILFMSGVDFNIIYMNTLTHCDALMLGGYLALSMRSAKPDALKGFRPPAVIVVVVIASALLLGDIDGFIPAWGELRVVAFCHAVLMLGLLAIIFVWLIYAAITQTSGHIIRFFSKPVLRWFGKYSYALYVLHLPIAFLFLRSDIPWISPHHALAELELFFLFFGCSVITSFLSWHLYEKHFLKLKRYFQTD
jgi:peptidoglycan/LPS O-acetylase OafA/YrhL